MNTKITAHRPGEPERKSKGQHAPDWPFYEDGGQYVATPQASCKKQGLYS